MNKELFVSLDIAKLAKQAGFTEKCCAAYFLSEDEFDDDGNLIPKITPQLLEYGDYEFPNKQYDEVWNDFNSRLNYKNEPDEYVVSAPLYEQLINWFEDKGYIITFNVFDADPVTHELERRYYMVLEGVSYRSHSYVKALRYKGCEEILERAFEIYLAIIEKNNLGEEN